MSTNLHLEDRSSSAHYEGLIQTPTLVTERVMKESTNVARLKAYLAYVEAERDLGPGQLLDHKVELLMWMVEHPTARFVAW